MTKRTGHRTPTAKRPPAWAVLLEWLLERGTQGVSVLEILMTTRRGRRLGASYRQRVTQLREMLGGEGAVVAESRTAPDGEIHTVYVLSFFYHEAAEELLAPHKIALCAERGKA